MRQRSFRVPGLQGESARIRRSVYEAVGGFPTEFRDEIEEWIIEELRKIGLDTARAVLEQDVEDLVKRTDLEEETILDVMRILKEEFED